MVIPLALLLLCLPLAALFGFLTSADRSVLLGRPSSFKHANTTRTYRLHQPSDVRRDTPIIVGLHEFGGTSQRFAYYTALHNVAREAIVIYPDACRPDKPGTRSGWNAKFCCGSGWVNQTDDVGFITSLVDHVREECGATGGKVFVAGFSNGAFMTHRLAAERPGLFDAVAVSSGSIGSTASALEPTKPIPILLMHGKNDRTVPYQGGAGKTDPEFAWLGFSHTCEIWKSINGDAAQTKIISYDENGHQWDGWRITKIWRRTPAASVEAISFFRSIRTAALPTSEDESHRGHEHGESGKQ